MGESEVRVNRHPSNASVWLRRALVRDLVQQNLVQLGRTPDTEDFASAAGERGKGFSLLRRWRMAGRGSRHLGPRALPRRFALRGAFVVLALGYLSIFGTSAFREAPHRVPIQATSPRETFDGELLHDLDLAASAPTGLPLSLAQMLHLRVRRVVIDPGHGGKDPGCQAESGLEEKTVTLGIARALAPILERRIGAEVILTRRDDSFVGLEDRVNLANRLEADLFLSIHLNWFPNPHIQRVETYFVGWSTDKESLELASRENAGGDLPLSEFEVVLRRMAQTLKVQESRRLAELTQARLFAGQHKKNPQLRDHGVGRAPFVVLMGTRMPSILAEVSFLSHPDEAARLATPAYVEGIARSLADGVADYLSLERETAQGNGSVSRR